MIDIFTVVVPHALMAIAIWRLIHCDDLDCDPILAGTESAFSQARGGFAAGKKDARSPDAGPDRSTPPRA